MLSIETHKLSNPLDKENFFCDLNDVEQNDLKEFEVYWDIAMKLFHVFISFYILLKIIGCDDRK